MKEKSIVFYDGQCGFCFQSMLFIQRKQKSDAFEFISIGSEAGKLFLKKYNLQNADTIVLIENEKVFIYSTAILRICSQLVFPYSIMKIFLVVPAFIRDPVYRFIAANRYRLFGKKMECEIIPGKKTEQ